MRGGEGGNKLPAVCQLPCQTKHTHQQVQQKWTVPADRGIPTHNRKTTQHNKPPQIQTICLSPQLVKMLNKITANYKGARCLHVQAGRWERGLKPGPIVNMFSTNYSMLTYVCSLHWWVSKSVRPAEWWVRCYWRRGLGGERGDLQTALIISGPAVSQKQPW